MGTVTGFREEVRDWIADHLVGEFARWRGYGGIGREDLPLEVQLAWDFVVGSKDGITGRMLWMRDDALDRVGEAGPGPASCPVPRCCGGCSPPAS